MNFLYCEKCGKMLTMEELLDNHNTDKDGVIHPLCHHCQKDKEKSDKNEQKS